LLLDENGLGNHRTDAARTQESGKRSEALLVTTIRPTVLLPSSLLPTTLAAIALATITRATDPELHSTSSRFAETLTENRVWHGDHPTTKNPGCRNNRTTRVDYR
jgi:hypothetical protein